MAKKRTSDKIEHVEQNGKADKPEKNAPTHWNSGILAFEWWEPAPDGYCSSPGDKRPRNPKP